MGNGLVMLSEESRVHNKQGIRIESYHCGRNLDTYYKLFGDCSCKPEARHCSLCSNYDSPAGCPKFPLEKGSSHRDPDDCKFYDFAGWNKSPRLWVIFNINRYWRKFKKRAEEKAKIED